MESHRKGLLDKVHEGEKQIDCLDYLVFQIERCSLEVIKSKEEVSHESSRKSNI